MSARNLNSAASGVYRTPDNLDELRARAKAGSLAWVEVALAQGADKAAFLAACKTAFALPAHFGGNWDALADSLGDSAVTGAGSVVHLKGAAHFAKAAEQDYQTALTVLGDAAGYWKGKGSKTFIVLVDGASGLKAL